MDASMELWNMFSTDMVEGEYLNENGANQLKSGLHEVPDDDEDELDGEVFDPSTLLQQSLADEPSNESATEAGDRGSPSMGKYLGLLGDPNANFELAICYICPACGIEFENQEQWKRHMNKMHQFNTIGGLNFVKVDGLYHKCLECNKNIAMHGIENLMKHKFIHLPYRCTKCKICQRQYKYKQDLTGHLRMQHYHKIKEMTLKFKESHDTSASGGDGTPKRLAIMDIQGGAHDIFGEADTVPVCNEILEPDDDDDDELYSSQSAKRAKPNVPYVEDSRSSQSDSRLEGENGDSLENYIQYTCPQCGTECETYKQWRQHIEFVHDFSNRKGLNFQEINMGKQVQCLECNEVLYETDLKNMQLHKFTHLPHPAWLSCKVCNGDFADAQTMEKHLKQRHNLDGTFPDDEDPNEDSQDNYDNNQNDDLYGDDNDDTLLSENNLSRSEAADLYEPHIDYICPACGVEIFYRKQWRKHIVKQHQLGDISKLNFTVVNEKQVKCNECGKIITNAYGVHNAQLHRITHLPFKSVAKCRICLKSYTDRKGLVNHLKTRHLIGTIYEDKASNSSLNHSNVGNVNGGSSLINKFNSPITSREPQQQQQQPQQQKQQQPQQIQRFSQKPLVKQRRKQIVRAGNVAFEITYLDDDDDDTNDSTIMIDDNKPSSFKGNTSNNSPYNRPKCADCGTLFASQMALDRHMKTEHDFMDYHNLQPVGRSGPPQTQSNSQHHNEANDDEDLLVVANVSGNHTQRSQTNHPNEAYEKYISYLCPACGMQYQSQMAWRRHINEIHNFDKRSCLGFKIIDKNRFQCTQCQYVIVSNGKLQSLQDHHFRHLPYKLYIKCLQCSTRYNHKHNMIGHLRVRHNIIPLRDDKIEHIKPKPSQPTGSPKLYINPKPPGLTTLEDTISHSNAVDLDFITYFCPECNKNFDSHVFWRKHIVETHNLASREGLNFRQLDKNHYLCLECYKRVTVTHTKGAIGQLQSHKFRHLPYRSFKCLTCNGEFVRKQMFFKHLNKETHRCDNINAKSESNSASEAPSPSVMSHQIEQNDSSFDLQNTSINSSQSSSTLSEAMQGSHFVLVCPQCGEQFDTQRPWREHINIEHGLNKRDCLNVYKLGYNLHQCLECGEQINGNKLRDLQAHKFKHLPHGPYLRCKYCSQGYKDIRNMIKHINMIHGHLIVKDEDTILLAEDDLEGNSNLNDDVNYSENGNDNDNENNGNDNDHNVDDTHTKKDDNSDEVLNLVADDDDEDEYLLG